MPPAKSAQTLSGACGFCGEKVAKNAVSKHLAKCSKRLSAIDKQKSGGAPEESLFHLRVQATESPLFWLDLEMKGSAKLKDLDRYLRTIWLECCGHLSQFGLGGWRGQKIAMNKTAAQVLQKGMTLTHIYDFGTSSITLVKVVAMREGISANKHPIALLARNEMPEAVCMECGKPAQFLCMECLIEHNLSGELCGVHAETHEHDNYGMLPICNSPRTGMCGYEGPAEPPY